MVNADYLENLAAHRFGPVISGERYLDKFVDIRLRLPKTPAVTALATKELALKLPLKTPFGDNPAFQVLAAAELSEKIASEGVLSFRQIKRVLDRVELSLRCYPDTPIDCPLLVALAFRQASEVLGSGRVLKPEDFLSRSKLTPALSSKFRAKNDARASMAEAERRKAEQMRFVEENCSELLGLPQERYRSPPIGSGQRYNDWAQVLHHLSQHYIQDHQDILDAVKLLEVEEVN